MQLSPQRTFVIQLAADTQILSGHMVGRIEHVVSHHAAHFDSLDSLLAFIAQVGREGDETTPERDTGLRATI
jgi:hypothetical protein